MYRYIGNKTKLLPHILAITEELIGNSGTVIDLMAGTGTVSYEFRKQGYTVIGSDMMTYSKCHLITQLKMNNAPEFSKLSFIDNKSEQRYASVLRYLNELVPEEGYFCQEFSPGGKPKNGCESRKYFSYENACKIDAIRTKINQWVNDNVLSIEEEALLKHTLIMAANSVANISGTYGYYLSDFTQNSLAPIILQPIEFLEGDITNNMVVQGFAEEIAKNLKGDLCYIDPPYMKRQYAANYHILETIARGDYPEAVGKSGLRDWWDQHSKFCTKTRGIDSFEKVISDIKCDNIIVSYSEDGLFTLDQMMNIMGKCGKVDVRYIDYNRFRSNQSKLPKRLKEYIIILQKI